MTDSFNMYELAVFWGPEKELEGPVNTSILHSLTTLWVPFLPPCPHSMMDCTLKFSNPSFLPEVAFLRYSVRSNSNNKTTKTCTFGHLVPNGGSEIYFQTSFKWFCGDLRSGCVKSGQSSECVSRTWTKQGPRHPRPRI